MPPVTHRATARRLALGTASSLPAYGDDLTDGMGGVLMRGSWNADIYAPLKELVQPEDVHCPKNRLSGMWSDEQPLKKYLVESGKRTLIFTGVNTDVCVLGTLADAAYSGWDCVAVEDACATMTTEAHEVCINNIEVSVPLR